MSVEYVLQDHMANVEHEHLFFRTTDGRACRLFLPQLLWEDGEDFERDFGGNLSLWLRHELLSAGEDENDFDINKIVYDLNDCLRSQRAEWKEIRALVGLAAEHGVGEPARLLRSKAPAEQDWLVPGVIASGGVTLIGGREKLSGKSTLLFYLIGRLEKSLPTFFGDAYKEPVKTLIVTEEPEYAIVDKLNRFDLNEAWIIQDWVWPLERFPGHSTQEKWVRKLEEVEKLAAAVNCRHVVVDPLSRIAQVEDESGRELGQRAEAISSMSYRSGLAISLIHHANKGGDREIHDRMRGSTSLTAAVEQIIHIEKHSKKSPRIRKATSYGRVEMANWETTFELEDDGVTYRALEGVEAADEDLQEDLQTIQLLGGEVTIKSFCDTLALDINSANEQKVRGRLERLCDQGQLEKAKSGKANVYRLT